jgi:hypothetical protein
MCLLFSVLISPLKRLEFPLFTFSNDSLVATTLSLFNANTFVCKEEYVIALLILPKLSLFELKEVLGMVVVSLFGTMLPNSKVN